MNGFIKEQVMQGRQVYIVCPAIEERECEDNEISLADVTLFDRAPEKQPPLKAAEVYARELAARLPHLRVGLIHGKLSSAEKESIMQTFSAGECDVLVSTTVIEVGVNVPNACLMIVENAERFGLSQLHQLRGRVGRGKRKSYCVLVSDAEGETALHFAVRNDEQEIAAFLLQNGADVDARNKMGVTPLMVASWSGFDQMVELLLKAGADSELKDENGTKAASHAREVQDNETREKILKLLGA
jgi:ATP-dependent DNA helicase RecG